MGNNATHPPRNRTAFGFATQKQALDCANEGLDLARKDILDLQAKTLKAFNLLVAGKGDFGTDMLRTMDAHAQTREFGKLLWERALIGQAVHESITRAIAEYEPTIQWMIRMEIDARERRRPHNRFTRWVRRMFSRSENCHAVATDARAAALDLARDHATSSGGTLTEFPVGALPLVASVEVSSPQLSEYRAAEVLAARTLAVGTIAEMSDDELEAVRQAIAEGDLGEGTDEEFAAALGGPSEEEKPGDDEPVPAAPNRDVTYPKPEEHVGSDVPGEMDDGIAGADEYRDNAKRDGEEKAGQ